MTFINPVRNHIYLGEFNTNADALAFIQTNKFDTTKDGLGNPENGMFYYNLTFYTTKTYENGIWEDDWEKEINVSTVAELFLAFDISIGTGKTIYVAPGIYDISSITANFRPPPYSKIIWGDGTTNGMVILDLGNNISSFSISGTSITQNYDSATSFTLADPTIVNLASGTFQTTGEDTDWYIAIKTGIYRVQTRNSNTQWVLANGPIIGAAAGNKPVALSPMMAFNKPSLNVAMEGRLHVKGVSTVNRVGVLLDSYGLDTRKLILSVDFRCLDGDISAGPVVIKSFRSSIGPIFITNQNMTRDVATATISVSAIALITTYYCSLDLLHVSNIVVTNNAAQNFTLHAVAVTSCQKCIVNIMIDQIRGEGAGGTRVVDGLRYDATDIGMVFAGSVDDISGAAGWTVVKTLNTPTDTDITGMRIA